jgi:hypothetical protein
MWEDPAPSWEEIEADGAGAVVFPRVFPGPDTLRVWDEAPSYPRDEHVGRFATTGVPMQMMNGTLDPQTGLEDAMPTAEHFTGPHQTFVVIERGVHGLLYESRYDVDDGTAGTCGMDLIVQFLADPTAALDTSCRTETSHLDFSSAQEAMWTFGTESMW